MYSRGGVSVFTIIKIKYYWMMILGELIYNDTEGEAKTLRFQDRYRTNSGKLRQAAPTMLIFQVKGQRRSFRNASVLFYFENFHCI